MTFKKELKKGKCFQKERERESGLDKELWHLSADAGIFVDYEDLSPHFCNVISMDVVTSPQ